MYSSLSCGRAGVLSLFVSVSTSALEFHGIVITDRNHVSPSRVRPPSAIPIITILHAAHPPGDGERWGDGGPAGGRREAEAQQ